MALLSLAKGMLGIMTIMMIGIDGRRRKRRRAAVDAGVRDRDRDPDRGTALGRVPDLDPDPEIVLRANLPRSTRMRKGIGIMGIIIAVVESIPMTKKMDGGIVVIDQDLAVVAAIGGGDIGIGRAAHDLDRLIVVVVEMDFVGATAGVAAAAAPGLYQVIVAKNANLQLPPSPLDLAFRVGQVGAVPVVVVEVR